MRIKPPHWDKYGYFTAISCVALATFVFWLGRDQFAKGQWALLYLLLIMVIAGISGVRASILAAVLSFFAWDFFFLPPSYTLIIHDPKDWLSLFVFLFVAVVMGVQTGRMREREAEAIAREQETSLLNQLSAGLLTSNGTHGMAEMLLPKIVAMIGATRATLFLPDAAGKINVAFSVPPHQDADLEANSCATWVFQQNKAVGLPSVDSLTKMGIETWPISVHHANGTPCPDNHDLFLPLQTATQLEGVLHIGGRMDLHPYSFHEARLLVSVANLVSGFLERQRLEITASHARALHETELLKSTLISSVSHELKTPLAAVTASISSLRGEDVAWEPSEIRDELAVVEKDLLRLNDSITALLDLSRLKADAWKPRKDWFDIGEIIGTALRTLSPAERKRIILAVPQGLPALLLDYQQLARALQHLVENALAYSAAELPVRIGASTRGQEVHLWVEDTGPGILPHERERIFEQFFRGAGATLVPSGTGLGLAITAEIVRFHGGRIWVEGVQPHGARFVIALPRNDLAEQEQR